MYIIEKIVKLYLKYRKKETKKIASNFDDNYVLEDVVTCKHQFLPIDSTGKILACSKCGFVINKERINKIEK